MIFTIVHPAPPPLPTFVCSFKPAAAPRGGRWKPLSKLPAALTAKAPLPARDKVIDFGKHKGKMLGAIPSSYLKWISGNLRAGDTLHWAQLADQVLQDSVYRDRIEWEFASRILDGSGLSSASWSGNDVVSQLVEISERFRWDNEDKIGWSRVDFELLGTSKGGRIPRLGSGRKEKNTGGGEIRVGKGKRNNGSRRGDPVAVESEERRKERRERMRLRKAAEKEDRPEIMGKVEGRIVNDGLVEGRDGDRTAGINLRFPGREGLLKKVLDGKKKKYL
ncbi:hypothetical protein LINPERPRIM_LOCUS23917 [Linum perenne]